MNNALRPIPPTVDPQRRDEIRARRQRARCTNVDQLAERLVGIREARSLAYAVNLPRWW